uniref:NADH dehydrogenase subunit 4L n=2 Tax=Xenos TaxID=32435 RepID=A0A7T1WQB4_9NEOP|nr:NADH dehydrogenase subunit 4L [Xenos yangi]QPP04707.1 NADH dehydrogenase subunit 4L [Xenos cf. moutoni RZ-2020]UXG18684.1 NADH dehydrogenase subunit 4L [Xenos yangi]
MSLYLIVLMIMMMVSFSIKFNHFLLILLSLEMIGLIILLNLFYLLVSMYDMFFLLFFMIILVCESVMGLSLLVSFIRIESDDYLLFYSLN